MILVDCYATWCPPCRAAAPIFAEMSLRYKDVLFASVDVDVASEVAEQLQVRAMPTFFLFRYPLRGPHEMNFVRGFNERALRGLLAENGATEEDPPAAHGSSEAPSESDS